jgi:CHAD domain-containing protein
MSKKWAEECDPDLPARQFARATLAERVDVVEQLLPRAAHHSDEDIEHVHQLRVGCRRASAALRAFAPLMYNKPCKLKKWLSQIRDAAGPARDADVLLARFSEEEPNVITQYAVARLTDERRQAQQALVEIAKRAISGKLDRAVEQTLDLFQAKKPKRPPIGDFGRAAVYLAYTPFARLAHLENPTTDELHQLRIVGKRLRYSLEIFHGLFPNQPFEEIYSLVEALQEKLGRINDHATAQTLYQSWLAEMPAEELAAQVASRVITEHKSLLSLQSQFLRWWNPKRVAKLEQFFSEHCAIEK